MTALRHHSLPRSDGSNVGAAAGTTMSSLCWVLRATLRHWTTRCKRLQSGETPQLLQIAVKLGVGKQPPRRYECKRLQFPAIAPPRERPLHSQAGQPQRRANARKAVPHTKGDTDEGERSRITPPQHPHGWRSRNHRSTGLDQDRKSVV